MKLLVQHGNRIVDADTTCSTCRWWGGIRVQSGGTTTARCESASGPLADHATRDDDACDRWGLAP